MKKSLLILPLIISLINFASAGIIEDAMYFIGIGDLILVLVFLISFTLIYISLNKIFKNNTTIAGILSFLISIGITAGISYTGFDISGIFFDLGIDEAILIPIILFLLAIGLILFIWKYSFATLFMTIGALLFGLSWISYEDTLIRWASLIVFGFGAFLWFWKKRDKNKEPGFWTKNRKLVGSDKVKNWAQQRKLQKEYDKLKVKYQKAKSSGDNLAMKNIEISLKRIVKEASNSKVKLNY